MNTVRKVTSTTQLKPKSGPQTAGIFVDTTDATNPLCFDPDGTVRKVPPVIVAGFGLNANLGAAAQAVFIADAAYQVVSIQHVVAVGVSGATATIKKTSGTTAPGSGTAQHSGTLDLNATANTVQTASLSGTVSDIQLAAGDRLWFTPSTGTLTGLSGGVSIRLKRI